MCPYLQAYNSSGGRFIKSGSGSSLARKDFSCPYRTKQSTQQLQQAAGAFRAAVSTLRAGK